MVSWWKDISKNSQPRQRYLTENDVSSFMKAASERPRYTRRTREALQHMLRMRNPWRWRRLQSDLAWAKKVMVKAGYDPEEIRWLL